MPITRETLGVSPSHCFAQRYVDARAGFLAAAHRAGLAVHSHVHPLTGQDGEALALDVARAGPADAQALLIVSSACHGVEGFAGSAVQRALLADEVFVPWAQFEGVAVLFLHGLNPWGFSWWERWTHENVDLNRNFVDFGKPAGLPRNAGHDELAAVLVPPTWPAPEADAELWAYFHRHGERATQLAISSGQYHHPQGLFYGGAAPTWSRQVLERELATQATRCQRLAWIDLHTATGQPGGCEHLLPWADDAAMTARARAWWGQDVKGMGEAEASLGTLQGVAQLAARALCPQAELTCTVLEFGTVSPEETVMALRANQWLRQHPATDAATRRAIKRRMRDAFYTDNERWKAGVLAQGCDAARRALSGLAAGAGRARP